MCKVCDYISSLPIEKALSIIAAEIGSPGGRKPDHFKPLLDKLLGTEEPVTNEAMDEAWERSNRGS